VQQNTECDHHLDDGHKFSRIFQKFLQMTREVWAWYAIGYDPLSTYTKVDYCDQDFHIWPELADIKTPADLQEVLKTLEHRGSPTSCYFEFDNNDPIFYRDQQDCILWAFDAETGKVYIHDESDTSTRVFVAKDLKSFVSRIFDENAKWWEINKPMRINRFKRPVR
jgi:hypothetical protein